MCYTDLYFCEVPDPMHECKWHREGIVDVILTSMPPLVLTPALLSLVIMSPWRQQRMQYGLPNETIVIFLHKFQFLCGQN